MKKRRVIAIGIAVGILIFARLRERKSRIQEQDACLCTEVLSNEMLLSREEPLAVVNDCKAKFTSFEKAHGKCIQMLPQEHPEVIIDSLKNI